MKTWPTTPTNDYDAANPGTTLVGFELELAPGQRQTIQVSLIPGSVNAEKVKFEKPLVGW